MENILSKLLGLLGIKLNTVYIVLAGLAVAVGVLWGAYYQGRQDGYAIAKLEGEAEIARQIDINTEMQKKLRAELDQLARENEALDNKMEKLREEADNDPAAASGGIGIDSVRRLNRIK
jgi:hypothetical protein